MIVSADCVVPLRVILRPTMASETTFEDDGFHVVPPSTEYSASLALALRAASAASWLPVTSKAPALPVLRAVKTRVSSSTAVA